MKCETDEYGDPIINGMDASQTETFLMVQEKFLYRLIDEHKVSKQKAEEAKLEYERLRRAAEWDEEKIFAVLLFLENHSNVHDDWFKAVGYNRYTTEVR